MTMSPQGRGVLVNVLLALLLAGFAGLVVVDPTDDGPLRMSDLGGQLLLGARVLAGERLPLDEWNPGLVYAGQTHLAGAAFRLFGTGPETARILTALAAVLAAFLFHDLVRRSAGRGTALLALLLLITNPVFVGLARSTLPAMFSLLAMLATIRLWIAGGTHRAAAVLAGAAVVWTALADNAPHTLFFAGAALFAGGLVRLHAWKMPWLPATRLRLGAVGVGAGLLAVVVASVVLTHLRGYLLLWEHMRILDARVIASNVVLAPRYLGELVVAMPVVAVFALFYFLVYAKSAVRPVARHRDLDEVRLWFLGWLLAGGVAVALTPAPGLPMLGLLVPPLCAVAAEALLALLGLRRIARPRTDPMIVLLMFAGAAWFGIAWLVQLGYARLPLSGYLAEHQIQGTFLLVVLLWTGVVALLGWVFLHWKRFTLHVHPAPVVILFLAAMGGALGHGAARVTSDWTQRTHEVAATRQALRTLPAGSLVAGSWAPIATLGTEAGAVVIFPGVNDEPRPWHDRVTHLLLAGAGERNPAHAPLSVFRGEGRVTAVVPSALPPLRGAPAVLLEVLPATPEPAGP